MRKWNGKPTTMLEEQVHELQGKTGGSQESSARVSSGQFPRWGRRVSDLLVETSNSYLQEVNNINPFVDAY